MGPDLYTVLYSILYLQNLSVPCLTLAAMAALLFTAA